MSAFDPETFLTTEVEGALDTSILPCPEGEFPAAIDRFDPPQAVGDKGSIKMRVYWTILDEAAKAEVDRDPLIVNQDIFLDVTDAGTLDMNKGKNIGLGRLRDALNMNSGKFSFQMLNGAGPALVKVTHREYQGNNYAEVRNVTKFVG